MNVEEEVGKLKEEIQRLGQQQPDGSYKVRLVYLTPSPGTAARSEPSMPPHFLLLYCHLWRGLGWDSSPPLSMLRALCSLMCIDQSPGVKLRNFRKIFDPRLRSSRVLERPLSI